MYVLIFSSVLGGVVLPLALDGSPWSLSCPWRVVWPGSVVYCFLHLCILVLVLFGRMVAT